MNRRTFLRLGPLAGASALALREGIAAAPLQAGRSGLKITGAKLVRATPRNPLPASFRYRAVHETAARNDAPKALLMNRYLPGKQGDGQEFYTYDADGAGVGVQITTDRGVSGIGHGTTNLMVNDIAKLVIGEDPVNVEKLWDIMWRSTMRYGRKGIAIQAISAIDLALWDLIGNATGLPVYKLLGGETKPRIPAYCTMNDTKQHVQFGFKKLKLALPFGPEDGRDGLRKNVDLVKETRELVGQSGEIMLDCIMSLTESYTVELAAAVEPYRVYWIEEPLIPDDYEGFGRLKAQIKTTLITTGEHEYTRYGFRQLLHHRSAHIWQPDIHWCGGLTEIRRIAALASTYDIPVIPHGGGATQPGRHFIMATVNSPWAECVMPVPGGPSEVYKRYEEDLHITRGPEGIYIRPSDRPGFGYDLVVS